MGAKKGSFIKSVSVLAGGTLIAQGAFILVSPVISRIYAPDELGSFGLIYSFVALSSIGATARYDAAIVSGESEREAIAILKLSLLICMAAIVPNLALYCIVVKFNILGYGDLSLWGGPLVSIAASALGVFASLRYWFIRKGDFAIVNEVNIFRGLARGGGQVAFGLVTATWVGLLLGEVASRFVGLGKMARVAWAEVKERWQTLGAAELGATARKFSRYPLYTLPSSLINVTSLNLALPIIYQMYGPVAAGQFAIVQRVIAVPLALVGDSVADVFHNRSAELYRVNPGHIRKLLKKTAVALVLIGSLGAGILVLLGPLLFSFAFGAPWRTAGLLAAAMSPWFVGQLAVYPLSRLVFVLDGHRLKLFYDVMSIAILGVAYYVGNVRDMSITNFVLLLSVANMMAYSVYFILLYMMAPKSESASP